MEGMEYIVAIVAILVGGTAVILPIAGLTARFALKPLVDSFAHNRDGQAHTERAALLEQRVALLEEQLRLLEREQAALAEASEFHRQLSAPR